MAWRSVNELVDGPLVTRWGGGIIVLHTVVVRTNIRCVNTEGIPGFLCPSKVLITVFITLAHPGISFHVSFREAFDKMVDSPHYSSSI